MKQLFIQLHKYNIYVKKLLTIMFNTSIILSTRCNANEQFVNLYVNMN